MGHVTINYGTLRPTMELGAQVCAESMEFIKYGGSFDRHFRCKPVQGLDFTGFQDFPYFPSQKALVLLKFQAPSSNRQLNLYVFILKLFQMWDSPFLAGFPTVSFLDVAHSFLIHVAFEGLGGCDTLMPKWI